MIDDWPTVRRYTRSLTEAFADERAPCIFVGYRPWYWRLLNFIRRML